MTRRIEFTVADEIAERYDEARGHEPLASWIKRALESALSDDGVPQPSGGRTVEGSSPGTAGSASSRAPGDPAAAKAKREAPPDRRVKGSTEARPFRPVPKAGKR